MEIQDAILISTTTFGFILFTIKFFKLLNVTYNFFIRPQKNLKTTYGSWALVTGSTDGIGKSIAFQLASQGINIILVGRNVEKLEKTVDEIKQKQVLDDQVEVKTIVIDFAQDDQSKIVRAIGEGISGLDLGILVNNVGLCYPYAKYFHEVDFDTMVSIVKVNVEGTSIVTKTVLNSMMMRKRGVVVNIGSGSSGAVSSYPLFAIYAATKAYIAQFSRSIGVEYKQYGIDVQCQIPLLVATKMASIRKSSLFIPSADTFSKASLRWMGYDMVCVPYWPHYLQCCLCSVLPDLLQDWCLYSYILGMRNRGLKKDATKPKKV